LLKTVVPLQYGTRTIQEAGNMGGNLLVVHGGGPTAVINSTLYGVIMEAKANEEIDTIYGAIGGM
jgi:hypothetical protein